MTVEEKNLEWYRALPVWRARDIRAFMDLPEYSAADPTGVRVGKMWRRLHGDYSEAWKRSGGIPKWVVCRYEEAPDSYVMTNYLFTDRGEVKSIASCTREENAASQGRMYVKRTMCKVVVYRPVVMTKWRLEFLA